MCFFQDSAIVIDDVSTDTTSESETIQVISSDSSDGQSEYGEPSSKSNNKRQRLPAGDKKKTKKRHVEDSTDDELMEKALSIMNQPNDEFDIFGNFVASEMRQISDVEIRRMVKTEIMRVLITRSSNLISLNTLTPLNGF